MFFFIPLSFSASIYSMKVKELDASQVSIAAFFALAIIITTTSYAIGFLIRSEEFVYHRKNLLYEIMQITDPRSGSSIPT